MTYPLDMKLEAIELHGKGYTIQQVCEYLRKKHNMPVKHPAVSTWVKDNREKILAEGALYGTLKPACQSELSPVPVQDTHTKPSSVKSEGSFFDQSILVFDIETLANQGYFFDMFSDRGIPLQFVRKHKAVCTIAYKWLGSAKTEVLVMDAPYDDKSVLEAFLPIYEQAKYVVAHYGDGFDIPFIDGRLFANKLPQLPKKRSLDTYKIAKKRFGRTLNSNKLDHLGTLLGLGNKNKTDAMLWVKCAEGDKEALKEMALYNVQDVDLLEKVFNELRPYFSDKINCNMLVDDITNRCKPCGSENLRHIGYELTASTVRDQYRCLDCNAVSSFKQVKHV